MVDGSGARRRRAPVFWEKSFFVMAGMAGFWNFADMVRSIATPPGGGRPGPSPRTPVVFFSLKPKLPACRHGATRETQDRSNSAGDTERTQNPPFAEGAQSGTPSRSEKSKSLAALGMTVLYISVIEEKLGE
jgi:hypothetical protein